MQDAPGSLMRHTAAAVCLMLLAAARSFGQTPAPAPPQPEFFSRSLFHLSANSLTGSGDERFAWDAFFGGEVDMVDYVKGRASISVDYHPVLGSEYRPFDPNQAYYVLETSGSYRAGGTEVAVVFHHVSRHLSDRPKRFAIAWNVLGVRALRHIEAAGFTVDGRLDGGVIVQHSFVDYQWTGEAEITVRKPVSPRLGLFAHATGTLVGVDGTNPERGTQTGGRFEAGVRVGGTGGAIELFAGIERRLDADPIDQTSMQWAVFGFRLLSR